MDELEFTFRGDGSESVSLNGLPLRVIPCVYGVLEDGEISEFGQGGEAEDRAEKYAEAHPSTRVVHRVLGDKRWLAFEDGRRVQVGG